MLENLEQLVRDNAQELIVNNGQVPNEHNEAAIQAASGSIFDTLKEQISTGKISQLADVFNKPDAVQANPVVQEATSSFTDKLAGFGINAEMAKSIGASLIPVIMGKLVNKTNDPNDSSFNIQDMLGKFAGGADGKFDLTDVMSMFNGGGQAQAGQPAGGGVLDKLKGLFN
ncbi:hypothetical protein EZ428_00745 [Pedobacter frigiditerrae]|uniref:DUF937 domain-containing protein n=1 Tax=Pedobacter frigiditerrae TaxID=2530452 RepID=A0A4R0N489_9SPHI|nr:hypothetical protein [Pedobacter frigiditerrae]TCC93332.1 hypothetical protein EZ428_00745 [Pedobacter frigiditerrae]